MSNLSIRERNALACFLRQEAQDAYLWALDKAPEQKAFNYANEVECLCAVLNPALETAAAGYGLDKAPEGLLQFMLERHKNLRFPPKGNK